MNPERWRQIEDLYHAALEREPDTRQYFLEKACGDSDLRREVESLLAKDGATLGGLLDSTVTQVAAGAQLGPYKIEEPIGAGGMGQVFKARDTRLGRAVAVKITDEKFTARFEREARAISSLNHPHICTLYDVGPNYLVMELCEGETLASRLKRSKLSLEDTIRFGIQIADALAEAHAKGITHRDLKPGNIMLTKSGVKVLDFGLARSAEDETITDSRIVMGTPAYMAPEQREGKRCDARTDIFALGLVLYEMATGKRSGQTPELNALPQQFGHVIERCLDPDPERRWQTARDLKEELGWAVEQLSVKHADKPAPLRWVAALVVALLMILACYAFWLGSRPRETQQTLRFRIAPPSGAEFFRAPNRGGIALSADGRMLAFTAVRDGQMRIWVQPLDSTAAREIPGTEGAYYPFWSPDGRALAFFAGRSLKRIDIESARLQELCMVERGGAGSWNREGVILFDSIGTVYRIAAGGGKREPVSSPDTNRGEIVHTGPQFLTDGKRFLYTINSQNPEVSGVYAGSLDDSKVKVRLTRTDSWVLPVRAGRQVTDYLLWARGDTIVAQKWNPSALQLEGEPMPLGGPVGLLGGTPALAVSQNGLLVYGPPVELQFAWVDLAGRSLGSIGNTGFVSAPQLSPDGRKFAYSIGPPSPEPLFILDLARNVTSRIPAVARGLAAWLPDGSLIAFDGLRDGVDNVVHRRADGGGTERVSAPSGRNQHVVGWLGDGKSLVYYESNPERRNRELWVTPLVGGKPVLLRSSSANEPQAQLSADTKWLAYTSDESGRLEVYAQRFQIDAPESGQRWQISDNGGNFPRWRRDGKELFYLSADGGLMSVSIKVSATALEIGPPRPLFPLPTLYAGTYSYDVAQDGLRFLVVGPSSARGREPLSVVVNWPAALGN